MTGPRTHTLIETPVGTLLLTAEATIVTGLYYSTHPHRPAAPTLGERDPRAFGAVTEQLRAYFDGTLTAFDIPYALTGTPFQRTVWAALDTIPFGHTVTYAQLADRIGHPTAVRAVGAANGRNPISIILPCHRVIGSDGTLTGYGGGLESKRTLLDLEARPRTTRGDR